MVQTDNNSLTYWFPLIRDLPIPQPKTMIYEIPADELKVLRTEGLPKGFVSRIAKMNPFGYPFFLRTDQASAKHRWEIGAFVASPEKLERCIFETISHNLCAGIFGLPFIALVLREYIPMDSRYKAFMGMPVNPERRYFVKDGKVVCHHAYWCVEAIRAYGTTELPINWPELSADMNRESADEIKLLTSYAEMVSRAVEGNWSVDFCKAKNGVWHLIDMALSGSSWHPEDCPHYVAPRPEELV
jgi:hypothetical protein